MVKNFIGLCATIGIYVFAMVAAATLLNYLFGLRLGFEGTELPDDPVSAGVFLAFSGVSAGIAHLLDRKKPALPTDNETDS
ncbi:MAG: hypothetical protein AB7J13_06200 [Pyrinomonadaceae bacterium]